MRYIQFYPDEKINDLQNLEEYYQLLSQSFNRRKPVTMMSVTERQKVLQLQSNSRFTLPGLPLHGFSDSHVPSHSARAQSSGAGMGLLFEWREITFNLRLGAEKLLVNSSISAPLAAFDGAGSLVNSIGHTVNFK